MATIVVRNLQRNLYSAKPVAQTRYCTVVHDQVFRLITWQANREDIPHTPPGWSPGNHHQGNCNMFSVLILKLKNISFQEDYTENIDWVNKYGMSVINDTKYYVFSVLQLNQQSLINFLCHILNLSNFIDNLIIPYCQKLPVWQQFIVDKIR